MANRPMTDPTPEELQRRRRGRNIAVLIAVFGLAALVYLITIVRLSEGVSNL